MTTVITYTYDPLYRLTAADYDNGAYFHYTYDAVGNRLSQEITGGLVTTYTYDIANRLTAVGGQAYTWDANGNLLDDGTSTYAYDAANRLVGVTQGTDVYSFAYNGQGDRLSQTINGVPTDYTLDLNAGLTQVLDDGSNTYLYGTMRLGELQPGGFVYHLGDALGSVRQLAQSDAELILAQSYEPFGDTLASVGNGQTRFQFTGEQSDSYINRWLQPVAQVRLGQLARPVPQPLANNGDVGTTVTSLTSENAAIRREQQLFCLGLRR